MELADAIQLALTVVTVVAIGVALFTSQRSINEQRRSARLDLKRDVALDVLDWLHDANATMSGWTAYRRSLLEKRPSAHQAQEDAERVASAHRRVGPRATFLLRADSPAMRAVGHVGHLFNEATETLGSPMRFAHHRDFEQIADEWNAAMRTAHDRLAEACDLVSTEKVAIPQPRADRELQEPASTNESDEDGQPHEAAAS